jgi:hypothetical protein
MNKKTPHHFRRNPRILVKNRLQSLRFQMRNPMSTRLRKEAMIQIDLAKRRSSEFKEFMLGENGVQAESSSTPFIIPEKAY